MRVPATIWGTPNPTGPPLPTTVVETPTYCPAGAAQLIVPLVAIVCNALTCHCAGSGISEMAVVPKVTVPVLATRKTVPA